MKTATITSKGQVTIPKQVRNALGLKERDQVVFVVEADRAIMRPVRKVELAQLRGVASQRAPFRGRASERAAAQEHVAEQVAAGYVDGVIDASATEPR